MMMQKHLHDSVGMLNAAGLLTIGLQLGMLQASTHSSDGMTVHSRSRLTCAVIFGVRSVNLTPGTLSGVN